MEKKDVKVENPAFRYESTIWNLGVANRRMLIALIAVCVTFILTITVFVHGYTVREKNWLDTLSGLQQCTMEDASQARTGP